MGKFILGVAVGYVLMFIVIVPCFKSDLEKRAIDLNIMRYDSKLNKFTPKDTIIINGRELNYLLKGITEKK